MRILLSAVLLAALLSGAGCTKCGWIWEDYAPKAAATAELLSSGSLALRRLWFRLGCGLGLRLRLARQPLCTQLQHVLIDRSFPGPIGGQAFGGLGLLLLG